VRLVLDTNTALSGLLWGGTPGRLIDAAKSDLIVSGDRHLLDLKCFQRIAIVTAAEALERVASGA
jgi:predicted nucleic acid-binding protein